MLDTKYVDPKLYDNYDRAVTDKLEGRLLKIPIEPNFSDNAISILNKRYFKKDDKGIAQEDVKGLFARVAANIAYVDYHYNKGNEEATAETAKTFYEMIINKDFMPNSPTLMNAGRSMQQLSACFVLPIHDRMEGRGGIMDGVRDTGLIHKSGGGTGFSFSSLRRKNDFVSSTYGKASGPVSFIEMYDGATNAVNQGGFRRGANMGMIRIDHPDVMQFIHAKENERDRKYGNFNFSVAVTDEFMQTLKMGGHYVLKNPRNGKLYDLTLDDLRKDEISVEQGLITENERILVLDGKDVIYQNPTKKDIRERVIEVEKIKIGRVDDQGRITLNAKRVFEEIASLAWKNGEPGVAFIDVINKDNPIPEQYMEATNPCVIGNTLVTTTNGLERIDSLIGKETEIITSINITSGNLVQEVLTKRKIKGSFRTGRKLTYKLRTKSGYEIIATADHKILTKNGWKKLKDLKLGEKIIIQRGKSIFSQNKKIKNTDKEWSEELGIMLGWLVGDGWFINKGKNCRAGFTFRDSTTKYVSLIKKVFNKIYGKEIKEVKRNNNTIHLSYHSKEFISFLESLGVKAVKAKDKRVPDGLFNATEKAIKGFLKAVFSTDGTLNIGKNKTRYIRLTSKSEKLLKDIQLLLLNFGIKSKIYERHRNRKIVFRYKTIRGEFRLYEGDGILYELHISKDRIPIFLNEIGFLFDLHKEKLGELKSAKFYKTDFVDEVLGIEENGFEDVYDLTEPITHSFIANGIIVHNCGEQPLPPYDACNLGSINLGHFVEEGEIDYNRLEKIIHHSVHFLDNVIDISKYPLPEITQTVHENRRIGLGVMGWADMLNKLRIPYNSKEAVELGEKVMKFILDKAIEKSQKMAEERGVFPNYDKSIYAGKIKRRNAAITTIAPTGTISIIADASSGIEPHFDLYWSHKDADGQKRYFGNKHFEKALEEERIDRERVYSELENGKKLSELDFVPDNTKKVFVVSGDISVDYHVKMQSAFQKYTENAVSKTINMPNDATIEDVQKAYLQAYELGCKGITVYRDRSREEQVLSKKVKELEKMVEYIKPKKRPEKLLGETVQKKTGCGNLFITLNYQVDGNKERHLFETFATMGKAGGCASCQNEAIGRLSSELLRSGADPMQVASQLVGVRCNKPFGFGPKAILSCADAMGKAIAEFYGERVPENIGNSENFEDLITDKKEDSKEKTNNKIIKQDPSLVGGACPQCGSTMQIKDGCLGGVCTDPFCGFSECS